MSRQNLVRFNVGGRDPLTPFNVKTGGSFTIPESKTSLSAVDTAFGGANLSSIVPIVGGQMLMAINDGASGAAAVVDLTMGDCCDLRPGDIVAISADDTPAAGYQTLSITGTDGSVRSVVFATTTLANAVGYYG